MVRRHGMATSRVENASRNVVFGMLLKGYQVLMPFLMRTVMLYYMGTEYLGLNSLFGSILWILNLAELGVGSAMVYSMYQPIIDEDTEQICALLKLYRTYYRVIGLVIAVVGTAISPLVPSLIKKDSYDVGIALEIILPGSVGNGIPDDINIYVVYWLNLLCTVLSYWLFAYKNSLIMAHQRNDVISKVTLATNTFQYFAQFAVIIFLGDYYVYLITAIVTQVITNIVTAICASKMYPDYKPQGKMKKEHAAKINQRIKDLFTMKLGNAIVSSADSIVVSKFLGLTMVAIYNNYFYILTAVWNIGRVMLSSCTAGIGNSLLMESKEKNYIDMKKFTFIMAWICGFCSACLLCLFQPFMKLWAGEDLTLGFSAVIAFVLYFAVEQINQVFITYKDAAGIWHEDRFRPLITALANLFLSILLAQWWGIYGVVLATVISEVVISMPWILHNIFSTMFKRSMKEYVLRLFVYAAVIAIVSALTFFITSVIPDGNIGLLLVKGIAAAIVSNLLFFVAYFKTKEFAQVKEIVFRILKRG